MRLISFMALPLLIAVPLYAVDAPAPVENSEGAVEIPFDMPADGTATIALYKQSGQILRPLAQRLELEKGKHVIRWDGLDLWGQPLPAGTSVTAKVITSPGIHAYYEFAAVTANKIPWLSKPFGEGEERRQGGWLADHSPPWAVCAIGNKLFLGSPLAEHGNSFIYTNLEGEKMWGGGLKGWNGPEYLTTDGKYVYAIVRDRNQVIRIDADAQNPKPLVTLKGSTIEALAVHGGKMYLTVAAPGKADKDAPKPLTLQVRDADTGDSIREIATPNVTMTRMEFAPDGQLYALAGGKLVRADIAEKDVALTVLNDKEFKKPISIAVDTFKGGRIAVGDEDRDAVIIFDTTGKKLFVIGDIGPRKRGPYDPNMVDRPNALAFDQRGKIWVVENYFTPRRVSRFSADGKFEQVFHGPPHYGGGGFLDPNLKSFYYEACEYALDWDNGTSKLLNFNDVQSDPNTPTLDAGSYSYTKVGRPIYYKGKRYVVGDVGWQYNPGFIVCILDGPVYRPCAVMGLASSSGRDKKPHPSMFLSKPQWKEHWEKQDLEGASFIWCDRNSDGKFDIDEVELFKNADIGGKNPWAAAYWGNRCGNDLTFWGTAARLAPSRFTDAGVPIYEKKNLQPFSYSALAPSYPALKGGESVSQVAHDGSLTIAGQPFQVAPDMKLRGGDPGIAPSAKPEYIPPILGEKYGGLSFVGNVETKSPVGEIGVLNGNGGVWYVISLRDALLLSTFFDGAEGSWSGLYPKRGMEVTHRKHDGETFFGDFIKADNGNYYAVAGKGFHAICRVEGLDDYKVQTIPVTLTAEQVELNKKLYPSLVASAKATASRGKTRPNVDCLPLAKKAAAFKLDGDLADWGKFDKAPVIGKPGEKLSFDIAYDAKGIYVAYKGNSVLGNASEDVKLLFKSGFCFDIMARANSKDNSGKVIEGDKRIVFGRHKGQWIAVLYDYAGKSGAGEAFDFVSPVTKTHVARVVQMPDDQVKVAVKELSPPDVKTGKQLWSGEAFISWSALGVPFAEDIAFRADFGILCADSGGIQVEKRSYWSNTDTEMVSDVAVESRIEPGMWGTVRVKK